MSCLLSFADGIRTAVQAFLWQFCAPSSLVLCSGPHELGGLGSGHYLQSSVRSENAAPSLLGGLFLGLSDVLFTNECQCSPLEITEHTSLSVTQCLEGCCFMYLVWCFSYFRCKGPAKGFNLAFTFHYFLKITEFGCFV